MNYEQREYLLIGGEAPGLEEDEAEVIGLCQMCEINLPFLSVDKSKRSSEIALIIIHRMLTGVAYKFRK